MGNTCFASGSRGKQTARSTSAVTSTSSGVGAAGKGDDLESQSYYFPDFNKVQAEDHLGQCEGRGTFLVRRSQTVSGEYSISVRNDEMVKHYRIQQHSTPPRKYFLSQQAYFDTLPELIRFYQENTGTGGLRLAGPAPRTAPERPNTYV